jgi:outer membrane protein assembly factor BamB
MLRRSAIIVTFLIFPLGGTSWTNISAEEALWPGWLGPQRNGWVSDFQPPSEWPKQLQRKWQVEVGTGYGSPLVVGDRVYQHARQGDDEVVWCFDLDSGEVKWRRSYPVPFKMGGGGEWHGKGPKSSPIYSDGKLFTMSITGVLSAWDAESGESLWRRDYASRFEKSTPYWGATTSPIVDGDRVIVHFGGDDKGVLVALDVESGDEIWSQGESGASYSSPLLAEFHGVRQIVEWNHDGLVGVESESGRLLWEYPFPHVETNQNMPTPAIHNGRVLVGGENRGLRSVEPQLNDGVWTVKQRWFQQQVALDMSSAVVNGDLLYGFSHYDSGRIFCLDTETAEVLWQGPPRTGQNVTFLSIPDHVVALIDDGELRVIKASGDGYEMVASYRVAESPTWAPPVVLQNGILVKDKESLTMWSLTR